MVPSTVASGVGRQSLLSHHPNFERDEEEEELYASRRRTSIWDGSEREEMNGSEKKHEVNRADQSCGIRILEEALINQKTTHQV